MLPAEPMEQHLSRLRRAIATSEGLVDETRLLALGVREVDAALGGGLPCAALHELSAAPLHLGAAAGFALALAALSPRKPNKHSGSRPISAALKPARSMAPASIFSGSIPSGSWSRAWRGRSMRCSPWRRR